MSPVPVVSATLTTRTVRELRSYGWPPHDEVVERLTVDPVFVVVDAAPDLTCRDCVGDSPNIPVSQTCPSCGGTGVSPVYAATRLTPTIDDVLAGRVDSNGFVQRRQVVEWVARRAEVLPVVGDDFSAERIARTVDNRLCSEDAVPRIAQRWGEWLMWTDPDKHSIGERIDAEPWAADLRPGQFVLRLSEWEHLQQPHTEQFCECAGDPDNLDPDANCPSCDGFAVVPLSVPDGVLSWIELA